MIELVPTQLCEDQIALCEHFFSWQEDYLKKWEGHPKKQDVTLFLSKMTGHTFNRDFHLFFVKDKRVRLKSGVTTRGIFLGDVKPPEMYLSTEEIEKELLLEYLCHEYSHYNQALDDREAPEMGDDDTYDAYLFGGAERTGHIENVFFRIMKYEIDCNKEALKLIEENNLPIDREGFIKRANAYHFYHLAALEKAQDYITDPSEIISLVEKMPTEIIEAEDIHKYFVLSDFEECFT